MEKIPKVRVVFSDISEDLLEYTRNIAEEQNLESQCSFICNAAEGLVDIPSGSIDVVVFRSVLIYINEKEKAFEECFRVLKKGGRLSFFEPINNYFSNQESGSQLFYFNTEPIKEVVDKLKKAFEKYTPNDQEDPMLNFTEKDLITLGEKVGFSDINLKLKAEVKHKKSQMTWKSFFNRALNPNMPTIGAVINEALTKEEKAILEDFMKNKFASGYMHYKMATAYVWGVK